ncbi:MAG: hypothetical protein JNK04_05655, partial [Myxococcales bacterium]|nr:hypothetical protein [Myxococcales bacterium]
GFAQATGQVGCTLVVKQGTSVKAIQGHAPEYAGNAGSPGLDQINFKVGRESMVGGGDGTFHCAAGSDQSNEVHVTFAN